MNKKSTSESGHYNVEYLEQVTLMNWVQRYKKLSYEMLELKPGSIILDAGCGAGDDVLAISKIVGKKGKVIGIDISKEMLEVAKTKTKNITNIELNQGNIYDLQFEDNTFDGVRADRVFQHLEDPVKALSELVRVTKTGGKITVMDPDWETLVFEHPDDVFTKRFLSFHRSTIANASSGRKLANLFLDQGLIEILIVPDILFLRSYKEANTVWSMEIFLDKGIEAGAFKKDKATKWLNELKALDKNNRFFGSISGFGVIGKKP